MVAHTQKIDKYSATEPKDVKYCDLTGKEFEISVIKKFKNYKKI